MIADLRRYTDMAMGVRRVLRAPAIADHDAVLQNQLAQRHVRFLDLARRLAFEDTSGPYFEMFRLAGCTYADLEALVLRDGLESALSRLAKEGVYTTHDEFKGKQPIVRGGRSIELPPRAFLNPVSRGYLETATSGSRGVASKAMQSPQFQLYREVYAVLKEREYDLQERARCVLFPTLPSGAGISNSLRGVRLGWKIEKWFSQRGRTPDAAAYRSLTNFLVLTARICGAPAPFPTYLPENDYLPVAEWVAQRKREGRLAYLHGYTSPAVRVAVAAREAGLDISGALFLVGGEALTDAKRAAIEGTGCEVYSHYHINEIGPIGYSCRQMKTGNCVHLFHDAVAVVTRRRVAPLTDLEVDSLLFTTLLPSAPRFLINAEMDDTAVVEPARCKCAFSAAGWTTQVRDIASIGKLTGQGITLFGTDIVKIIEGTLPLRFGGAPGDYQLVEQEGAGQTQMSLYISPRVGIRAPDEAAAFFLGEVRRCYGGALATRLWQHSHGFGAVVKEPIRTRTGKNPPLHLLGPGTQGHTHAT